MARAPAGDSKLRLWTKFFNDVKSIYELEPMLFRLSLLWCDFFFACLPGLGMAAIVGSSVVGDKIIACEGLLAFEANRAEGAWAIRWSFFYNFLLFAKEARLELKAATAS